MSTPEYFETGSKKRPAPSFKAGRPSVTKDSRPVTNTTGEIGSSAPQKRGRGQEAWQPPALRVPVLLDAFEEALEGRDLRAALNAAIALARGVRRAIKAAEADLKEILR